MSLAELDGFPVESFRRMLLEWWERNKRAFPWRQSRDPFRILIAEVLLHRTRSEQVQPLYAELFERFPSPQALAEATEEQVTRLLHPLGLRWRAELLPKMARKICDVHGGRVPDSPEALRSLPGVGQYIASAVRCFALGKPDPLLDTNTVRVIGRMLGLPISDASRRSKRFREIMTHLVDTRNPRRFNFALIDHAALICKPVEPLCRLCHLLDICDHGRRRLSA